MLIIKTFFIKKHAENATLNVVIHYPIINVKEYIFAYTTPRLKVLKCIT